MCSVSFCLFKVSRETYAGPTRGESCTEALCTRSEFAKHQVFYDCLSIKHAFPNTNSQLNFLVLGNVYISFPAFSLSAGVNVYVWGAGTCSEDKLPKVWPATDGH